MSGERKPSGAFAVGLEALRAELDAGWPAEAGWEDAGARKSDAGETGPALIQPADQPVRYRLRLAAPARLRAAAALGRGVRRARLEARVTPAGRRRATARWRGTLHAPDGVEAIALELPAGELTVELWVRGRRPRAVFRRRPSGRWIAPRIELSAPASEPAAQPSPEAPPVERPAGRAPDAPSLSLLTPVHDPEPEFLSAAIDSVRAQTSPDWQLCLADDGCTDPRVREILATAAREDERVVLVRSEPSEGISGATNRALAIAAGEHVGLLDHDDVLAPGAVEAVARAVAEQPDADMLYSDEDHLQPDGSCMVPYRKPEWSPDLMRSIMFVGHLGVYRRALVAELGGFRSRFDGSQDYDLALRVSERARRILHVPEILYHWRVHPASAASGADAKPYAYEVAKLAIDEHLARAGIAGHAEDTPIPGAYRVVHDVDPDAPVAILVPVSAGDEPGLDALAGALSRGGHDAWRLVLAGEQGTVEAATRRLRRLGVHEDRLRRLPVAAGEDPFRALLAATAAVRGPGDARKPGAAREPAAALLLLDAPLGARRDGWLRVLLGFAQQPRVAAVGAKVLARDGRVDNAGLALGRGLPRPVAHGAPAEHGGVQHALQLASNPIAVDGAVMLSGAALRALGGPDPGLGPQALPELCLRARARGWCAVLVADALLQRSAPAPAAEPEALAALHRRLAHGRTEPASSRTLALDG